MLSGASCRIQAREVRRPPRLVTLAASMQREAENNGFGIEAPRSAWADLRELLKRDVQANAPAGGGWYKTLWALAFSHGLQVVLGWRLVRFLSARSAPLELLGRCAGHLLAMLYGVHISPLARIGAGLALPHPVGIVLGDAVLGEGVTIYQNVTIGQASKETAVFPRVGNGVTIYAGAVLIGDIEIGDCAVVGANSVVIASVPANAHVAGNPAKLISR